MSHHVKGVLFAEYVRMVRGSKSVPWATRLADEDLPYLRERIDPDGWYPMAVFERLGNAILTEVAGGDPDLARMWGRVSVDQLHHASPNLVAPGDPVETLMRFRVLRATFFDFDALEVRGLASDHASIAVHYFMGPRAEEAAALQTMGFFERLLALAGAEEVDARFLRRAWIDEEETLLELHWR